MEDLRTNPHKRHVSSHTKCPLCLYVACTQTHNTRNGTHISTRPTACGLNAHNHMISSKAHLQPILPAHPARGFAGTFVGTEV